MASALRIEYRDLLILEIANLPSVRLTASHEEDRRRDQQ